MAVCMAALMNPHVLMAQNKAARKDLSLKTGTHKYSKSVPGKTYKESSDYMLKIPKTKADLDAIDLAEVRQLERGEKRREEWNYAMLFNGTVSHDTYRRLTR